MVNKQEKTTADACAWRDAALSGRAHSMDETLVCGFKTFRTLDGVPTGGASGTIPSARCRGGVTLLRRGRAIESSARRTITCSRNSTAPGSG